jgi:hypothetical protein
METIMASRTESATRTVRRLLGLLAGLALALVLAPAAWAADYSDSCTSPTATVADGYAGSGTYVRLRAQPATGNPSTEWVCYRVSNPTAGNVGGRFDITGASVSGGGAPSVDSSSQACETTTPNQVPGVHPLVSGTILSRPFDFDAYASSGAAWVCAQVASVQERLIVPVPSATVPSVVANSDSPAPALPAPTADPYPSGTCQNAVGGSSPQQLANMNVAGSQVWAYEWQPDQGTVDLCARVQGPATAGGVLSVSADGSPGITPVVQTGTNPAPCTFSVFTLTNPTQASLSTTLAGANPATVCVGAGASMQTYTVGVTGQLTPPAVTFTPDPGTP